MAEIVVVDNASSDGSRNYFEGRFPQVKFIWLENNIGFGRANNSALARATGEFVLFLNPDTIVAEDTFDICLAFASKQTNFGALGIRMIDGSGNFLPESKRMFPSLSASFYKMTGITRLFPRSGYISKYYAAHLSEYNSGEVEVLAGACMMVRKSVLDITNGFDEDFFMYGEDIDLSYRIIQAGFKNFYCGDTSIIHFKGESIQRGSASYLKNFYGAMLLFVKKHSKRPKPSIKAAILAAYAMARLKQLLNSAGSPTSALDKTSMAIAAREDVFNKVLQIVKLSVYPFTVTGRIGIDENDVDHSLGSINQLKSIVRKDRITHIVMAEGELSFKKMIEVIMANKNAVRFFIHAYNSKSIVGSNDKNTSGYYIAG